MVNFWPTADARPGAGSGAVIVVSDTTPLMTLMRVGRLGILGRLSGEVLIPSGAFG